MMRGCHKHNKISILAKTKFFKILTYVADLKIEKGRAIICYLIYLNKLWCNELSRPLGTCDRACVHTSPFLLFSGHPITHAAAEASAERNILNIKIVRAIETVAATPRPGGWHFVISGLLLYESAATG